VHRQFRKLTKTKDAFPNENSLLKLLYAGILNATEKWTMPIQNWSQALPQLNSVAFGDFLQFSWST
jgi:putative transposase